MTPPPLCSWTEVLAIAVIAMGAGFGLGSTFSHWVFGELPWFAVTRAEAVDGNTIAITALIHVDGLSVPQLDRNECIEEKALAERARSRVQQLLDQGTVRVRLLDENEYGQITGLFVAADRPVGPVLVRERLARPSNGTPVVWCPNAAPPPPTTSWFSLP